LQDIAAFYQKGNGNFWLALNENKLVGTMALADYGENRGYLKRMYVDRAYRRQGIARQLLSTMLAFAKAKKYKTIFLGTVKSMTAANNFYMKNGFVKIPALPEDFPEFGDNVFYKMIL
jgi:ribosomal protein S18 acetylase RimI-like enzyme